MAIQFGTATRRKAKLRLAILGPAGGGKTKGALRMASGLAPWDKIFFIDTERGSASLYADMGPFQVLELDGDFHPQKYIDSIKAAEDAGAEVIIVDSLTHAWAGTGGTLDLKGAAEAKSGNGWTAWRNVTPLHNALVETMLQSKCHVIGTMRVKMEYVQEKDASGKTVIRKVGLQPIQRDGVEYEFTTLFDVDADHFTTSAKDRTSLFEGQRFIIDENTGKKLKAWLESGVEALPQKPQEVAKSPDLDFAALELKKHVTSIESTQSIESLKAVWGSIPAAYHKALVATLNTHKTKLEGVKNA